MMKDKEVNIFLRRIKENPMLFYLIVPFTFKIIIDKLIRKFHAKKVCKIVFPAERIDSLLEFSPLEFIYNYQSCDHKPSFHFEHQTEIDKNDEQFEHYFNRLNNILFVDEKLINVISEKIGSWIDENPSSKKAAWHPYNVSERIVNVSIFLSRFNENLNNVQKQNILKSLYLQSKFLYFNFEHHLGHHNHLINNSRALLYASAIFRNHPIAKKWQVKAFEVIRTETIYQFLEDGVHAEQSSTYHLLLTRTYWELKQLYNILNEPISFEDQLNKMVRYFDWIVRENQTIPFIGHITPDVHWQELVGFGNVILKNKNSSIKAYSNLFKPDFILEQEESKAIKLFYKAGVGVMKINHAEIFLSNDPRSQIMNHGDQNQLGIDISWHNSHIIRDTGLDSYNINDNRNWFESWEGQSCCVINAMDPIVSNWRRRQLPASQFRAKAIMDSNNINTIKATHDCYNRIGSFITLSREVAIKENKILISDTIQQTKSTVYNAVFHFGDYTVTQINQELVIKDLELNNSFTFKIPNGLQFELKTMPFAVAYGEKRLGTSIFLNGINDCKDQLYTYTIEKL